MSKRDLVIRGGITVTPEGLLEADLAVEDGKISAIEPELQGTVAQEIDATGLHLKVLARIARFLKDKVFRNSLRSCKTAEKIYETIRDEDERST